MSDLTAEQKKIVRAITREARKRYGKDGYSHAEKVKIKAALETGRVESNFTNSSVMTDHDSQGWRQERASLYKNPTNVRASTRRFFDEADQHYKPGLKSGDLAANVQRPAAQYRGRYAEHSREAQNLMRKFLPGGDQPAQTKTVDRGFGAKDDAQEVDKSTREQALRSYLADRGKPGATLDLARSLKGGGDAEDAPETAKEPKAAEPKKASGRVDPWDAAMSAGATVSSSVRPGAITSAGNPSDHGGKPGSGTMARDFVGKDMDKIARRIAAALGLKNYKGGLVNVNKGGYRYQLIWRAEGHYDHVHLGRKPL